MAKERIVYLDLAKFLAIALVCVNHCYFLTSIENPVYRTISAFYMPLFMLMCGFFSVSSFQLSTKDFLQKKGLQLLIPSIVCSVLSCLILTLFGRDLLNWKELYGGVWFLKTLFACYLIVFVSKKLISADWLACVVSSMLLIVLPFGYSLMVNYMLLFFWTGYFLRKHYSKYYAYLRTITLVTGGIFCFACICGQAHPQFPFKLQMVLGSPVECLIQYTVALAGSFFALGLCSFVANRLKESSIVTYLSKVGQYTLGIYIVQTIVLERIFLNIIHFDTFTPLLNYVFIPFLGLIFCFISYELVLLLKNYKFVNFLFFGNQYQ